MGKRIMPVTKILIGVLIGMILLSNWRLTLANQTPKAEEDKLPSCQSKEDIERYHGTQVKLIGTYRYTDTGKCWVAEVLLKDTPVVIGYQPASEEVEKFNNKDVVVIGKILGSFPQEEQNRQWLRFPHLIDVQSIKEYSASPQFEKK